MQSDIIIPIITSPALENPNIGIMNSVDAVIIIVLIGCLLISLARGFTVSVFGLTGIIFGLKFAGEYYSVIGETLGMIISPKAANIIGYLIICLFTMLLAARFGLLFKEKVVSISFFRFLDRFGGLLFGLVMGVILWELIINYTQFVTLDAIRNSRIASFLSAQASTQSVVQFADKVIQQFP